MTYASRTDVPIAQSKSEIERTLTRYGATKFFTGWDDDDALVGFSMEDRFVQFKLPLPRRQDFATKAKFEQGERSAWRALLLCIKAKLESVESGIETFEEAFLSHIMVTDGGVSTTIGDMVIPQIDSNYEGGTPLLALPRGT